MSSGSHRAAAGVERQFFDLDGDAGDIGAERFHQQIERGGVQVKTGAAGQRLGLLAGLVGGVAAQFDHVGDGAVELAHALLLALVVAFEIEADGLENQQHAGRGVLQVRGQQRRVGSAARRGFALAFLLGAAARQGGFGVGHPDEPFGGEQRERAGVVDDFGQGHLRQVVPATAPSGTVDSSASLSRRRS